MTSLRRGTSSPDLQSSEWIFGNARDAALLARSPQEHPTTDEGPVSVEEVLI
jgi:hypothetical protein